VNAEPPATPASTIEKTEGNDLQVTVSELYISQDFMPMVPASGPPLHALLTLEINGKDALRAAKGDASGTITITRPNGEIIARSNLTASRASDDLSLAQPGPQHLTLDTGRVTISTKLTEGETLQGSAVVTIGDRQFELQLPQTEVKFTM
jgi:hypothetical protein